MIDSVRIGLLDYAVEEVTDIRRKQDDAYLFGFISHEEQSIDIRDSLQPTLKAIALLHEIIHGVLFHTGHFLDGTDEERVCVALSHGLVQIMRDNPALVTYLCEDRVSGEQPTGATAVDATPPAYA